MQMGSLALILGDVCALALVFVTLGTAAYDYLCPSLKRLSVGSGLSQNIIGVTLIAFGNSSIDIFNCIVAFNQGLGALAVGSVLGASLFISGVVLGLIAVAGSFEVEKHHFMRDSIFLLVAACWTLYIISDGIITVYESLSMLALYCAFAAFVVFADAHDEILNQDDIGAPHDLPISEGYASDMSLNMEAALAEELMRTSLYSAMECANKPPRLVLSTDPTSWEACAQSGINDTNLLGVENDTGGPVSPIHSFTVEQDPDQGLMNTLFPSLVDWKTKSFLSRVVGLAMVVPLGVLAATIPSARMDTSPVHLRLHALLCPLFAVLLASGIPSLYVLLGVVIVTAILIALTAFFPQPPPTLSTLGGFAMSTLWIMALSQWLIQLVQDIGYHVNLSDSILGLVIVAIGNSLGDLASNLSIARMSYCMMALSACYGGPLLSILIGIGGGSALTMLVQRTSYLRLETTPSVMSAGTFLCASLFLFMAAVALNGWHVHPSFGYVTCCLWLISTLLSIYWT